MADLKKQNALLKDLLQTARWALEKYKGIRIEGSPNEHDTVDYAQKALSEMRKHGY